MNRWEIAHAETTHHANIVRARLAAFNCRTFSIAAHSRTLDNLCEVDRFDIDRGRVAEALEGTRYAVTEVRKTRATISLIK